MSADATAHLRIRERLDTTRVVVGGPGTGKTAAVVERAVELLRTGEARLGDMVVITSSDAASGELRQRLRDRLERATRASQTDTRIRRARGEVDDAAICTLHAFAHRILLEHCDAAGLPPEFEVLDGAAEVRDLASRWARFTDAFFDDPHAARALVRGFASGLRHTDLYVVARALHDHWDRLEDHPARLGHVREELDQADGEAKLPDADPGPVLAALDRALSLAHCCTDDEDNLLGHLRAVAAEARAQLQTARPDEGAILQVLTHLPPLRSALGRREHWGGRVGEVRDACAAADRAADRLLGDVRRAALEALLPGLVAFVLGAAEERKAEGRLTRHDLLVHARRLLRSGGEPLTALRRRYRSILVDEFEDRDAIEVEIAARLAAAGEGTCDLAATRPGALFVTGDAAQSIHRSRRADLDLGVDVVERVVERVGAAPDERAVLGISFRAVPEIVDFVDMVVAGLFGSEPAPGQAAHRPLRADRLPLAAASPCAPAADQAELPLDGPGSPEHLRPAREAPPASGTRRSGRAGVRADADAAPAGVPVVLLGGPMEGSVADVRRQAARDAARAVHEMVTGGWLVGEEDRSRAPRRRTRRARFGDVAVLVPTPRFLPALEEAFDDAALPYRFETPIRWASADVRDVLTVLRAADDPVDPVAVVASLRCAGLGCGDDDLVSWHLAGGTWDPRSAPPDGLDGHPVARAMQTLAELHHARWWTEPSALVARACEVLRLFELALAHRHPRERWRQLHRLYDQARLFDETEGGTLRDFLAWAERRAEDDESPAGPGLADPDEDAVRVMSVRDAKGMEFPAVVVCGLERQEQADRRSPPALWTADGRFEVRAGPLFCTAGYEEAAARDKELDALERTRLLYVAMTRARDHLVLCLHHRSRNDTGDPGLAHRLFDLCARRRDLWRRLPDDAQVARGTLAATRAGFVGTARSVDGRRLGDTEELREAEAPGGGETRPGDGAGGDAAEWRRLREQWRETRSALLDRLRRPPVVALGVPTSSARDGTWPRGPRMQPAPGAVDGGAVNEELPPQVARAFRGALAAVDLATGRDPSGRSVEELAPAHALACGVESHAERVSSMTHAALGSDVVRRAATRRHWRDLYVAAPHDHPREDAAGHPPATCTAGKGSPASGQGAGAENALGVVEGYADLVFEDEGGLVIVHFTTDQVGEHVAVDRPTRDGASANSAPRAVPGVAYAAALESASGLRVVRYVSLDVSERPAVEQVLEGDALTSACALAHQETSLALAR